MENKGTYATPKTFSATRDVSSVEYRDDKPDLREWLNNLKRNLMRQVMEIDELLLNIPHS